MEKQYSKLLSEVTDAFHTEHGDIRSLEQLQLFLISKGPVEYNKYVDNNKNDFANWVEGVFGDYQLGLQLRQAKNHFDAIRCVQKKVAFLKLWLEDHAQKKIWSNMSIDYEPEMAFEHVHQFSYHQILQFVHHEHDSSIEQQEEHPQITSQKTISQKEATQDSSTQQETSIQMNDLQEQHVLPVEQLEDAQGAIPENLAETDVVEDNSSFTQQAPLSIKPPQIDPIDTADLVRQLEASLPQLEEEEQSTFTTILEKLMRKIN